MWHCPCLSRGDLPVPGFCGKESESGLFLSVSVVWELNLALVAARQQCQNNYTENWITQLKHLLKWFRSSHQCSGNEAVNTCCKTSTKGIWGWKSLDFLSDLLLCSSHGWCFAHVTLFDLFWVNCCCLLNHEYKFLFYDCNPNFFRLTLYLI